MDLNELLSYKPNKRSIERREDRGEAGPPSKVPRTKLGTESLSKSSSVGVDVRGIPTPLSSSASDPQGGATALDINGISDEEKLRLLQSMDDKEEDTGETSVDDPLPHGTELTTHSQGKN